MNKIPADFKVASPLISLCTCPHCNTAPPHGFVSQTWEVVVLDQNYRSTSSILGVANAVITSGVPTITAEGQGEGEAPPSITATLPRPKLWTTATDVRVCVCGVRVAVASNRDTFP